MKTTFAAIAAVAGLAMVASANLIVTESFNGLANDGTGIGVDIRTGTPFTLVGNQATIPGIGGGAATWYAGRVGGTATGTLPYSVNNGLSNSGAIHSYGTSIGNTDRSLGSLASGSNTPGFGVAIINTTTDILTAFSFSLDAEEWRRASDSTATPNAPVNRLLFSWGVTGSGITAANFLTSNLLTADAAGDVVGTAPAANTVTGPALIAFSFLGTVEFDIGGLSVAPGQSIFLRWNDFNDIGNDAGLAIEDFNFTAVPTPGSIVLLAIGGLVATRRRRA